MIAAYFAISLAIENVVSAPRVISSCLPISTTSISLVGLLSRSTILPASLAACVRLGIATASPAWARAGGSLVAAPVVGTGRPPIWYWRISLSVAWGVAWGRRSSTPASAAIAAGVGG